MNNEVTLTFIKSYIDDIKQMGTDKNLTFDQRQHMNKAAETYISLFEEARRGKIDPDELHEHITSFMYMLQ